MTRRARCMVLVGALGLAACTTDFGAFDFATGPGDEERDAGRDPMADASTSDSGSTGSGSGDAGPGDGGGLSDAGGSDAAVDAGDSGPAPQDAQTPEEDAGVPPPEETCDMDWESAGLASNACSTCACDECAPNVVACLTVGSATDQARCAAVLECAIANDCKDWPCYCSSSNCGGSAPSGNGPCAAQMDAAAGGTRAAVMAIREAGDPTQPLVRAMNSIACVLGLHQRSPGGPLTGQCDAMCP